jgi:hypothetical protein
VVPPADFLAALRSALYKRTEQAVPMRLLSVTVQNFPVGVLKSIVDTVVLPAAINPTLPEWDRQEAKSLLWQDKVKGVHYYHSYIVQTWDAVSALCSFEELFSAFLDGKKHGRGNWRGVGNSGDLVVVLPPVNLSFRWELVCDMHVTMHQCTTTQHWNALAASLCSARAPSFGVEQPSAT